MNRSAVYWGANACFGLAVLAGCVLSPAGDTVHPLYLIPLFALCSAPVLSMRVLNDRYGLLILFGFVYFVFYGLLDFVNLMFARSSTPASDGLIGADEAVILVGAAAAQLGYHLVCRTVPVDGTFGSPVRDWPESTLVRWGALIWAVSTWLSWQFRVHVIVDTSIESAARGMSSLSGLQLDAFLLAGYLQPMGIVILAYAYCVYRKPYILPLLLAAILVEIVFGFVSDSKGQALIGMIIVTVTKLLVDGKLPKIWLAGAAAVVLLIFPLLQANRIALGLRGTDHARAAQDIVATLTRAFSTEESVSQGRYQAETFFERSSLKNSVTMIVTRTGNGVEYQGGHTLSPLLTTFIPRLVWPDKPDVPTGRLVNQQFHVSEQESTNISPSHLGELYWNFGWPGVLIGMPLIGALLGFIAVKFDLQRAVTLTRILVLIATVKLLIIGFESVLNVQYSQWMRMMVAIGLLHILFARAAAPTREVPDASNSPVVPQIPRPERIARSEPRYPNLMT